MIPGLLRIVLASLPTLAIAVAPGCGAGESTALAVSGRVVSLDGAPVAGVLVGFCENGRRDLDGRPAVLSATDGRFRTTRPRQAGSVRILDVNWTTIRPTELPDEDRDLDELTVVVAPRVAIRGVVVEVDGAPLAGASVQLSMGRVPRLGFPSIVERLSPPHTRSARNGSFELLGVPWIDGTKLKATARGFREVTVPIESSSESPRITLERRFTGDDLSGIVVLAGGEPAASATASLGDVEVCCDEAGRFTIALWQVDEFAADVWPELFAFAPGLAPARARAASRDWRKRAAWPPDLTLRLAGPALSIRGIALHADGTPVEGVRVAFAPPEPFCVPRDRRNESEPDAGAEGHGGSFETPLVEPGAYRLVLTDPDTLDEFTTNPIDTGEDNVVIRMPPCDTWPPLQGVVVDRLGRPCRVAEWFVGRRRADGVVEESCEPAITEAVGRIALRPLARSIDTLSVRAYGVREWLHVHIASLPHDREFRIVAPDD